MLHIALATAHGVRAEARCVLQERIVVEHARVPAGTFYVVAYYDSDLARVSGLVGEFVRQAARETLAADVNV